METIKIKEFILEESKRNKGSMILVAIDENNQKWVCSADHWSPTYLKKYEDSFDARPPVSTRPDDAMTC
jgi:hypothetical protein